MKFQHYKQLDQMDCGPTCLRMVGKFYGRNLNIQKLRNLCQINREGASLLGINDAAEKLGFRTSGVKINLEQLNNAQLPCILHWRQSHYVVLYKIKKAKYCVADPSNGLIEYKEREFKENWLNSEEPHDGIVLLLSPSAKFYEKEDVENTEISLSFLLRYLIIYRKLIFQLFLGLIAGSLLQLITPFLTQSIVDTGINTRNLNFIHIILIAQVMLFLGSMSVDFIRSWILLHISTRLNISILSDFLIKMMRLPMSFFDTRMTGDIMQRMNDQRRIEAFLTGSTLSTVFSLFNLIVFSIVLAWYNSRILYVFAISTILYTLWIIIFLKRRRLLDYQRFDISSQNQSSLVGLVAGMQEIKLNNCEKQKRWEWERIQAKLFNFSVKSLSLDQYQSGGSMFINQGKNIMITFLSAKAVIEGDLTLGGMIAIQYIVGQLNSPIEQLLAFIQSFQDAKISLERLNEIHKMDDEEIVDKHYKQELPLQKSIDIRNLTFRYPGAGNERVLKSINLHIPQGKTTAIVGMSGSGKTTILKLLLRIHLPEQGEITIGDANLNEISHQTWRSHCGVVMQDGHIFSDNIMHNIAVGEEFPDQKKLQNAIKVSNLKDLIMELPLGLNTMIGAGGNGISQGQKQRILIARAVYKNPEYIFFDEATNALDAKNERIIMDNLEGFLKEKTVVVVAHRLSTVSNADNIIVLDKGKIIEQGTHYELAGLKGEYYDLVKNQLEFGM